MALYDTAELARLIEDRKPPLPFYLRRYFPSIMEFDKQEIVFDYVIRNRRIAPFVSPMAEGKVMRSQGSTAKIFKPAYVKPLQAALPTRAIKRLPGEGLNGQLSPKQRMELIKAEIYMENDEMIDNRLEWMAVQALKTGQVIVEGEDYPKQVVDYGRAVELTVQLLTTARWNDSAPNPLGDIESLVQAMAKAPFGAPATDIYFDPDAWADFRVDPQAKDLTDTNFRGNESTIDRGPLALDDDVVWVGRLQGRFDMYVDSRQYEDEAGLIVPYLASGEVLFCSTQIQGVQGFGAIMDDEVLVPMRAYPSEWKEKNPTVTKIMTQSAPLPIPARINASALLRTR